MHSANVLSHDVFGMEVLPTLRTRTLYQHNIASHFCQYSIRKHCVNTPVVGALVHPLRAVSTLRVVALSELHIRALC